MAKIAIITDSTSDLPGHIVEEHAIQCVPQVLIWDGETLLDGVDITPSEFYSRLVSAGTIPTTSQATIGTFKELYEPHVAEGTPILAILVSGDISGTVQSAVQAKEFFPEAKIEIVDSKFVSMGLGYQVLAAVRAASQGKTFEEVVEIAEKAKDEAGVVFVVDTLEFLHRGGRIGGAARLFGTALKMKPLLEFSNGTIEALAKIRTKSKAKATLLDLIAERLAGKSNVRMAAIHANTEEEADELLSEICHRCDVIETHKTIVGSVVGTHAGPGAVGLAYYSGP